MTRKVYPLIVGVSLVFAAGLGLAGLQAPLAHADPGFGSFIALPAIRQDTAVQAAGGGVVLQVQNLGITDTQAALFLWPAYTGYCEPQAPGPQKLECSGIIRPGSAWVWTGEQLPAWAASGTVMAVPVGSCDAITPSLEAALGLVSFWPAGFEDIPALAVDVTRVTPGDVSPEVLVTSSYGGLTVVEPTLPDPVLGGFSYYAPTILVNSLGYNSLIYIQNLGDSCTSVELWLRAEGECLRSQICDILALAPGETYILDPATCIGGPFRGSAWIRSSMPMAILVEQIGQDTLTSYSAVASHVVSGEATEQSASQVNYGPLIFREYQGWETAITVQNLSAIYNAAVKVYFLDASGDIITTVMDWICPRGSQTFYLPVINGLPGMYVGSVRVESQASFAYPNPPNITSVATLTKYEGPTQAQALESISYNLLTEQEAFDWQLGCDENNPNYPDCYPGVGLLGIPSLMKDRQGISSEIAIQNINPNPGFTDFAIFFYDQHGLLDYVCQKLNEKQVEYIDLDTWGYIHPGFLGSAVISATYTTQAGGFGLGAVVVERTGPLLGGGDVPGDESNGHTAIPFEAGAFQFQGPTEPICPGFDCDPVLVWGYVYDSVTGAPVGGAHVVFQPGGYEAWTNNEGYFIIPNVPSPRWYTVYIYADDYAVYQEEWRVHCSEDLDMGTLYIPRLFDISGFAHQGSACDPAPTDPRHVGRTVELWQDSTLLRSTQTDTTGYYEFTDVPAGTGYHLKIIIESVSYQSAEINLNGDQSWNFKGDNTWCQ